MTVKRLFAVGFIFVMTTIAWFLLGTSLWTRGHFENRLAEKVKDRWGGPLVQKAPEIRSPGQRATFEPAASDIKVDLKLDYRRVGLLWYPTYTVEFDGIYEVENTKPLSAKFDICIAPPPNVDEFIFEEMGKIGNTSTDTRMTVSVPGRSTRKVHVHYRSQGMGDWSYAFPDTSGMVRNFRLAATTNFRNVDFLTVSPTDKAPTEHGWSLTWKYVNSRMTGKQIVVETPRRQNPGDLASRISFFAPISLLFFFTVMVVIQVMKKINIHPMNYFFVSAGFFAFNLLLAYLADHVAIQTAFFISAAVSVFLVVTYLRLVTGARFALLYAGACQLVFLVGFSYAFFFEGFAGLAVTVGAIITLFILMQITGRVKWSEVLAPSRPLPPPGTPLPPRT